MYIGVEKASSEIFVASTKYGGGGGGSTDFAPKVHREQLVHERPS